MSYITEPKTVAIVGAPIALGQKLPGIEKTPDLLRNAGLQKTIESFGWKVEDHGNIDLHKNQSLGLVCKHIADTVEVLAQKGRFCLTVGGDHSIAFGSISGILRARPEAAIVWVDAHGDINTPLTSPSGNLHGMPLAGLLGLIESATLPGFEWLRHILTPDRIALVGVRSLDPPERAIIRKLGIQVFTMYEIDRYGIGQVMDMALKKINPKGNRPLHLSLDIDALDPYIAPNTGTKERGGLTYREAHFIAEALAETNRLSSMDLVEINSEVIPLYLQGSAKYTHEEINPTIELGLELIASALGKRIL